MKNKTIILLILMPVLALGQSNSNMEYNGDRDIQTEIEKQRAEKASNASERSIETTLVDDRKYYQSLLNFAVDKSYDLSLTFQNNRIFKFIDEQESDEGLLEVVPSMDLKWQFRKPGDTENLFRNQ